ncbi:hypothetical protein QQ008_24400 [Fulvivirgaceae bacterium BMA10]|uniref:Uncharacterized protein n=1 Tax=Splendidivirga corallicola TaxID=3051826 RepID=A0ABT8KUU8_9BACT|nr:hypothetical protein [Fulvivirgaceae bacterium BMA10]
MNTAEIKLRNVLKFNATFSTVSGVILILLHKTVASWMNAGNSLVLMYIGIALLLFAGSLFMTAHKKELSIKQVKFIILQDWLWVIGSFIIIALQAFQLNTQAYILIAIVALIVALFAMGQRKFLKEMEC